MSIPTHKDEVNKYIERCSKNENYVATTRWNAVYHSGVTIVALAIVATPFFNIYVASGYIEGTAFTYFDWCITAIVLLSLIALIGKIKVDFIRAVADVYRNEIRVRRGELKDTELKTQFKSEAIHAKNLKILRKV